MINKNQINNNYLDQQKMDFDFGADSVLLSTYLVSLRFTRVAVLGFGPWTMTCEAIKTLKTVCMGYKSFRNLFTVQSDI